MLKWNDVSQNKTSSYKAIKIHICNIPEISKFERKNWSKIKILKS